MNKLTIAIVLFALLSVYGVAVGSVKKSPFQVAAVSQLSSEDCGICTLENEFKLAWNREQLGLLSGNGLDEIQDAG